MVNQSSKAIAQCVITPIGVCSHIKYNLILQTPLVPLFLPHDTHCAVHGSETHM